MSEEESNIYKNLLITESIFLKPKNINTNIDTSVLEQLKRMVEGKCIKYGYVMPNSIKIISRSLGRLNNANFEAITTYEIKYSADICNPRVGQIIICKVININKSQTICYIDNPETSPLEIYLEKSTHIGNVDFMNLKLGDIIKVKIAGSTFKFNDKQIICIAQFLGQIH